MYKKHTYPNGLRLISKPLSGTEAVTVLVLVGAGSRYETKEINGISHFLEHMFFKGAAKYPNTKSVSEAIDSVGGEFNAFTGKEYAGYYVKVAATQLELALDVLSDMLLKPNLDSKEIDKERGVILEEYNMYQDTPMYQIGWTFENQIFGDQPMGWDQIGTKELIQSVQREQFVEYLNSLYTADNIVIGIAGNVDPQKAETLVEQYFTISSTPKTLNYQPYLPPTTTKKLSLENKKTEQAHLIVGVAGVPQRDPKEWTTRLVATILGGNMSSRMFLSVREAQGLAYYISTSTDMYSDTGLLSTRAGVDTSRATDAIKAIIQEYQTIAAEPVTEAELQKAKNYIKGKIVLKLEDSEEYAHMLCRQELLHGNIIQLEEVNKLVDAVTTTEIQSQSQKLFQPQNIHCAIIGPYENSDSFENILPK